MNCVGQHMVSISSQPAHFLPSEFTSHLILPSSVICLPLPDLFHCRSQQLAFCVFFLRVFLSWSLRDIAHLLIQAKAMQLNN